MTTALGFELEVVPPAHGGLVGVAQSLPGALFQFSRRGQGPVRPHCRLDLSGPVVHLLSEERVDGSELLQAIGLLGKSRGFAEPAVVGSVVVEEVGSRAVIQLPLPADGPGELGIGADFEHLSEFSRVGVRRPRRSTGGDRPKRRHSTTAGMAREGSTLARNGCRRTRCRGTEKEFDERQTRNARGSSVFHACLGAHTLRPARTPRTVITFPRTILRSRLGGLGGRGSALRLQLGGHEDGPALHRSRGLRGHARLLRGGASLHRSGHPAPLAASREHGSYPCHRTVRHDRCDRAVDVGSRERRGGQDLRARLHHAHVAPTHVLGDPGGTHPRTTVAVRCARS